MPTGKAGDEMKQNQASITRIARLLETAAKKHNESADATCSVAECFEPSGGELSDEMFDTVFDTVTELAHNSLDKKLNYRRAARELNAKAQRQSKNV